MRASGRRSRPVAEAAMAAVATAERRARAGAGDRILASYVKRMYDAGIRPSLGTDAPDPGNAALSDVRDGVVRPAGR